MGALVRGIHVELSVSMLTSQERTKPLSPGILWNTPHRPPPASPDKPAPRSRRASYLGTTWVAEGSPEETQALCVLNWLLPGVFFPHHSLNVQADLDELPMIVGFRPMKYLKQLEEYGLKIPEEKIVDLLDAEENGQKFDSALSLAKRWNERYADNLIEPLPFYSEMELGRVLYIRICNNDDTPNPPQKTSIFDFEDRYNPDDDGLPF